MITKLGEIRKVECLLVNLGKYKRNQRLIYISQYFLQRPNQKIDLKELMDLLQAAKTSLSEDIKIVSQTFLESQVGQIESVLGAGGGYIYRPGLSLQARRKLYENLSDKLSDRRRILPGNYIMIDDLISDSKIMDQAGRMIADFYPNDSIDRVMTIETKGIPLALLASHYLNVPLVFARRDSKTTSGPTLSVNYLAGSHQEVSKMEISKHSLNKGDRVLLVDDFLRNGGTLQGLTFLLEEFGAKLAGTVFFAENAGPRIVELPDYESLVGIELVYDPKDRHYKLEISPGSIFKLEE